MNIDITLTTFNYTVTLPRAGIRQLRGSLLAQALELEPNIPEIKLSGPDVKPEHLDVIAKMVRQEKLDLIIPESYIQAARYLNWPLLDALSSGYYHMLLEFSPNLNIYRPETYGPALAWSIVNRYESLTQHILQVTDPSPMDAQALILAAATHTPSIVKFLLTRVDPVTATIPRHVLFLWQPLKAIDMQNIYQVVQRDHVNHFLEGEGNYAFRLACAAMVPEVNFPSFARMTLAHLLADERVRNTAPLQKALEMAVKSSARILLNFLLEETDVDPNIEVKMPVMNMLPGDFETKTVTLIDFALQFDQIQEARMLAQCPRTKVSESMQNLLEYL